VSVVLIAFQGGVNSSPDMAWDAEDIKRTGWGKGASTNRSI
jgi:hypothetical protein